VEASSTLKLEPAGRPVETLDESYKLDSDGKGGLHVVHDNGRGEGLEAILTNGTLYARPRYLAFTRRRPEGDDVERLRLTVEGVAHDYLELLARWLLVSEVGRVDVGGHAGVKLKLSAVASPAPMKPSDDPGKQWRESVRVRFIDGEVVVDTASGALLAARVDSVYTCAREGQAMTVTLGFKQTTTAAQPIVAPAESVDARRPRPMLDKQVLLDGLTTEKKK
jgi:hypothetical protein